MVHNIVIMIFIQWMNDTELNIMKAEKQRPPNPILSGLAALSMDHPAMQ